MTQPVQLPTQDEFKAMVVQRLDANEINGEQATAAIAQYKADLKKHGPPLSADQFTAIDEKVQSTMSRLFRGTVASFAGVSPTVGVDQQKALMDGFATEQRNGLINAEKFRMVNPEMAALFDEIGPVEASLIGAGGGLLKLGRGITGTKQPAGDKQSINEIKEFGDAGGFVSFGEMVGETAPFLFPATLASGIASVPIRGAVGTVLGGIEGGVIARGEEGSVGQGAGIGVAVAGALELGVPVIGRMGGALFRKLTGNAPQAPIMDATGNYTDEFIELLNSNNISADDFMADVQGVISGDGSSSEIANAVGDIATALKTGGRDLKAIAANPDIDPEVLAAANRLGVAEDLPLSAMSRNQKFQELEQGISSIHASDVNSLQEAAIIKMKTKADEIISDLGGTTTDSGALSDRVLSSIETTRTGLQNQSDQLYNTISDVVPSARVVDDITPLREYIAKKLDDVVGQTEELSPLDKKLQRFLGTEDNPKFVTYGMIDKERRAVGEQLGKISTPYPDATKADLEQAYGILTDLQGSALENIDASMLPSGTGRDSLLNTWDEAKGLVAKRKDIEGSLVKNFGQGGEKAIIPTLEASLFKIDKKGFDGFKKAIDAIPEDMRGEAVATALNKVFTSGSRQSQLNMGGYADWWAKLNRNQTAKAELLKHLPEGGAQRLEDLALVADKFRGAMKFKKDTGRVVALFDNFDKPNGLLDKIYNLGGQAPDPTTRATSMVVRSAMKGGKELAVVADRMMASTEFKRMVVSSVNDPSSALAQKHLRALTGSKQYNMWVEALPKNKRTEMLAAGLIPWLVGEDEEQQQQTGVQP